MQILRKVPMSDSFGLIFSTNRYIRFTQTQLTDSVMSPHLIDHWNNTSYHMTCIMEYSASVIRPLFMIFYGVFAAFRSLKAAFIVILHSEKVLLLSSTDKKKSNTSWKNIFHFWINYPFNEILLLPHSWFLILRRFRILRLKAKLKFQIL